MQEGRYIGLVSSVEQLSPLICQLLLRTTKRRYIFLLGSNNRSSGIASVTWSISLCLQLPQKLPTRSRQNVKKSAEPSSGPSSPEPADHQNLTQARGQQELCRLQAQQTPKMGELEPWHLHLHPLFRYSSWNGNPYQQSQIS